MAFFGLIKDKNINKDKYFDPKDYSESDIEKSFRNSRASNRISVDTLSVDTGANDPNGRLGALARSDVLEKKRTLNLAASNVLVQAIMRTRNNQVAKFCVPARWSSEGIGYKIVPKSVEDLGNNNSKKVGLSDAQIKRIVELEDIIYYTGKGFSESRDTFPRFATKILDDFYIHDQINIERVYESPTSFELNHFNAVDASTILIEKYPKSADATKRYMQIVDGKTVAHFNEKDLTFITNYSKQDVYNMGYGYSAVEAALSHLTFHANTEQYNARFFSQGGMTRGLLVINNTGSQQSSQDALNSIRRSWTPLQGLSGAWKIPMITATDAKYVNMTQNSKDMEFSSWLEYLIKMICALFTISPEEINYTSKGTATGKSTGSTLNEGNSKKDTINSSKNKGLEPVLQLIENTINDKILRYIDSDYRFEFTLGDLNAEMQKAMLIQAQEKAGKLLNEGRIDMGLDAKEGLDVPGDATNYIAYLNATAKDDVKVQEQMQHSKDYKKAPKDQNAPDFKK